ncbi:MAG: hypothetical protein IT160_17455 [Bryobacterales bacterium]|nr:hypothetical protein [Bryobacterales bacterium]
MVRNALARQGLRIAAEVDITGRLRNELGAAVAPCRVIYVDDPILLLEAVVFNRAAALLIPQPLVVTGNGGHSEVHVHSSQLLSGSIPESAREPLLGLQTRIIQAIESGADPGRAVNHQ